MCTRYYMESSPELRPYVEKAKGSSLTMKLVTRLGRFSGIQRVRAPVLFDLVLSKSLVFFH